MVRSAKIPISWWAFPGEFLQRELPDSQRLAGNPEMRVRGDGDSITSVGEAEMVYGSRGTVEEREDSVTSLIDIHSDLSAPPPHQKQLEYTNGSDEMSEHELDYEEMPAESYMRATSELRIIATGETRARCLLTTNGSIPGPNVAALRASWLLLASWPPRDETEPVFHSRARGKCVESGVRL